MKIKVDFITNSSSASFTILRSNLNAFQELLIVDHIEAAALLQHKNPETYKFDWISKQDAWSITVTDTHVEGWTSMDNFDMLALLKHIGVPDEHIEYDHS